MTGCGMRAGLRRRRPGIEPGSNEPSVGFSGSERPIWNRPISCSIQAWVPIENVDAGINLRVVRSGHETLDSFVRWWLEAANDELD